MTDAVIRPATSARDLRAVRRFFVAYQEELGIDLCFQGFADELATLPGRYAPPSGRLLVAFAGDAPIGCVGLRRLETGICEMKRLYVEPTHRGTGTGRALARAVISEGREAGYSRMRLDTLRSLAPALALYSDLGFDPCPPYYDNPLESVVYLERAL